MKIFVKNLLDHDVVEHKVGAGTFTIPAGGKVEIKDIMGEHKLPMKKTVPYLVNSALEVAQSIIQDFGQPGLELDMEDEDGDVLVSINPSAIVEDIKQEASDILDRLLHRQ